MIPPVFGFRSVVGPGDVPYLAGCVRPAREELVTQAEVGCCCFPRLVEPQA
jgi:hypothetical protein